VKKSWASSGMCPFSFDAVSGSSSLSHEPVPVDVLKVRLPTDGILTQKERIEALREARLQKELLEEKKKLREEKKILQQATRRVKL